MKKHPCTKGPNGQPCGHIPPPGGPFTLDYCRLCYLFAYDEAYYRAWGGPVSETAGKFKRPKGPGLIRRAWNYARAVYWHRRSGKKIVSEAVARRRLDLCESCDHFDSDRRSCRLPECGCYLDVKVTWGEQTCPIGRWHEES